jgi:predicted nuclease of predicted toxin-antitoxin system
MPVGLYADVHVHVPRTVVLQLRSRGVDVLAAAEQEVSGLPDDRLLALATSENRVMVTQDIRFRVLAENWQRTGESFAGLIFAHQR